MTQIAISDKAASILATEAASRGCTPGELASMYIEEGRFQDDAFGLTPGEDAIIRDRLSHPEDAAFMTSEEVDARFEALYSELRAR